MFSYENLIYDDNVKSHYYKFRAWAIKEAFLYFAQL